uniref:Uncharacterized protein n=1 Tax=Setaria italica TaxID=4555 RepID=K3ZP60_SETIT
MLKCAASHATLKPKCLLKINEQGLMHMITAWRRLMHS